MPELDRKALKEAASLGEKLFAATMANTDLKDRCEWADLHEWHRASFEKTALAFAASLTHDETANATITALRASLEEAEDQARDLQNGEANMTNAWREAEARAVAAEQRERRLREVVAGCCDALKIEARANEMSANLMRDPARTGGWRGAENVARSYDRHGLKVAGIRATLLAALSEEGA